MLMFSLAVLFRNSVVSRHIESQLWVEALGGYEEMSTEVFMYGGED